MRVVGRTSEVDLEILRQVSVEVRKPPVSPQVALNDQVSGNGNQPASVDQIKVSNEELQRIISEIKRKLDWLNRYLKIEIDDQLEIPVVKVFERDTNRLIRQVPPEHILSLMRRIDELLGVFLSERV